MLVPSESRIEDISAADKVYPVREAFWFHTAGRYNPRQYQALYRPSFLYRHLGSGLCPALDLHLAPDYRLIFFHL
jgi:hypothetical protein